MGPQSIVAFLMACISAPSGGRAGSWPLGHGSLGPLLFLSLVSHPSVPHFVSIYTFGLVAVIMAVVPTPNAADASADAVGPNADPAPLAPVVAGPSLGSIAVPLMPETSAAPNKERLSRALTAILRHEFPGQAFTSAGLRSRLHFTPMPEISDIENVLRTARRNHGPRFMSVVAGDEVFWYLRS